MSFFRTIDEFWIAAGVPVETMTEPQKIFLVARFVDGQSLEEAASCAGLLVVQARQMEESFLRQCRLPLSQRELIRGFDA